MAVGLCRVEENSFSWYNMCPSCITNIMQKKTSADRHRADSVQLKAWVPSTLRTRFNACCQDQGVSAAAVLRDLMDAYCRQVEVPAAKAHEGSVHVAG